MAGSPGATTIATSPENAFWEILACAIGNTGSTDVMVQVRSGTNILISDICLPKFGGNYFTLQSAEGLVWARTIAGEELSLWIPTLPVNGIIGGVFVARRMHEAD